jgi:hypothetical protein
MSNPTSVLVHGIYLVNSLMRSAGCGKRWYELSLFRFEVLGERIFLMSGIWKRKKRSDIQIPTNRNGRKQLWLNLTPPREISTLPAIEAASAFQDADEQRILGALL